MLKSERIALYEILKKKLSKFSNFEIETSISKYFLDSINKISIKIESSYSKEVFKLLHENKFPCELESIIEFFEFLLDSNVKSENGIVFTPKYIANYICNELLENDPWKKNKKIIDPGCGAGIFLLSAIELIHNKYNIDIDYLIETCIFGIDIEPDNVRRCSIVLRLLSAKYNGDFENIRCNILCGDSLKLDWGIEFNTTEFSYIIGNPPYVNPHDLNRNTIKFLKDNFYTTKSGVFNIFYAFIEHSITNLSKNGNLGFIIPNNFLTIKSATNLRDFLRDNNLIYKIIDFADNMIFRPTRTYNSIIFLNKDDNEFLNYHIAKKTNNIETYLNRISFFSTKISQLDSHGWKLVDENTRNNLLKIENNAVPIKPFIRTGIATLKDAVYIVDSDKDGYYKIINNEKVYVEKDIVKPIYKIPDLKLFNTIKEAEKYIIFPYKKSSNGYILIDENDLKTLYPSAYKVLASFKEILGTRDKGRPNYQGWYAYGRTQGLNKYGKKLLFPTFSNNPKFMYVENENALFCNGYGIFENDRYDLELLQKILNSNIMNYYVKNTSYSIEGGYYCYQKKYIERFSIPRLTDFQIKEIKSLSGKNLDNYLWSLYQLD